MRPRIRSSLSALAAAASLAALSGCGSSTTTAVDPVAQAAVATAKAGGANMKFHGSVSIEGLSAPITIDGEGQFNFAHREGRLATTIAGLPSAATSVLRGNSMHINELYTGEAIYLQSPLFEGKLPGGARWMKLDIGKVAQASGLDPSSLTSGQSNPGEVLDYLRSAGDVSKVGTDQVRGVQTTHYRAVVDLVKAAERLAKGPQAKAAVEKLFSKSGTRMLPIDVWVDGKNLVRKMSLALDESPSGQHVKVAIGFEIFGFGATETVTAPTGKEVFDATKLSLSGLGSVTG